MLSAGTASPLPPHAGGLAPRPSPIGFRAKVAAHFSFLVCGVASVLFAASLTVLSSAAQVVLRRPSAAPRLLPAYRQAQPEAVVVWDLTSGRCAP